MMKYFRVGNSVDDLPLYVQGEDLKAADAVRKVEDLCGPIPSKYLRVSEVKFEDIPEGEEPLT